MAANIAASADHADLNLRILQSLALWVKDTAGGAALAEMAAAGGVPVSDLSGHSVWVSWERFERILAAAAAHTADEDEFRTACAYRMRETYGPLLVVLRAATPQMLFGQIEKAFPTISAISSVRVKIESRTRLTYVYRSAKPESRLMCLSRQSQTAMLTTLWGLPRGMLRETCCIARGDETCEYEVRWHALPRWFLVIAAMLTGVVVDAGASLAGLQTDAWIGVCSIVSLGLLAYALEQRIASAANVAHAQEAQAALAALAAEEAEVRRELVALEYRQADWSRRLERELDKRNRELEVRHERARGPDEGRVRVLRGQVHDLRNMLMAVRFALESVDGEPHSDSAGESLADAGLAVRKIDRMLCQAIEFAEPGRALVALDPERVGLGSLGESLRRRLRALTHGKGLRVSVSSTREAPDSIVTDPLLLDRVLDNLLGNAAKYTVRGSVDVEVDGTPGFLIVKIADTGPGIASERIERVFRAGGSAADERVDGFGVGLSVVVQLLAQIGGRLEVMSKPGEGTTFWVHVPLDALTAELAADAASSADEGAEQLFKRVVQIRSAS